MTKVSVWQEFIYMLVLAFVCGAFLAGTHYAIGKTTDFSKRSIDSLLDLIEGDEEGKIAYEDFFASFKLVRRGKIKLWQGIKKTSLIACEASGKGMWGEITLVFVYDLAESKVIGLRVTEQNETPGLGDRILEEDFSQQFVNWKGGTIDGITGATTSSRSVERIVSKALSTIKLDYSQ